MKKNYLWLLPFYMAVATCLYYQKVRRMMHLQLMQNDAIVLYLLKNTYFQRYLQATASENLSGAAILIFSRYFGSSSPASLIKKMFLKRLWNS